MKNKLYVGNLAFSANEDQLRDHFSSCGEVKSAKIIKDRESGRSKGFGFIEMANDDEASTALEKLNGKEFCGRPLRLDFAKESR